VKGYTLVAAKKGETWVTLTDLGAELKRLDATFKPEKYGCSSLRTLFQKQGEIFQVQETGGGQALVRIKPARET
jgi:hypothetical protein